MRRKRCIRIVYLIAVVMCVLCVFSACDEPHTHSYANGECECGEIDETYIPPHTHSYANGECECGEIDIAYVKTNAVMSLQKYATEAKDGLSEKYIKSVEQVVASETLIINVTEDTKKIPIKVKIACYRIDLVVLMNNRDEAISVATSECNTKINYYAGLANSFSESDIYLGTEAQYRQEKAALERQIIDARSNCEHEKQRIYNKYANMGLSGSGIVQYEIELAERQRNTTVKNATSQKEELERLWENRKLYLEYLTEYQYWVEYKEYCLQDIESWYQEKKLEIETLISNLQSAI